VECILINPEHGETQSQLILKYEALMTDKDA
jgi:hypothetical protein